MKQLVVTGAAGFIGSNLARKLNKKGFTNLLLADDFSNSTKNRNLEGVSYTEKIERNKLIEWLTTNGNQVEFIFHLGARTDTTEFDFKILDTLNLTYSKLLWEVCVTNQIPLLYASSAATYGLGENGFCDDHSLIKNLNPLNPYGLSKHLFDLFALEQETPPSAWFGLKFFNVYGPYESHKGRMASVAFHAYNQIKSSGKVKLFKSHHPDYKDGEQLRDFIYVEDVVDSCINLYLNHTKTKSGIYNVGTGKARTFHHLVKVIFNTLHLTEQIDYIPIPEDIREKYQYFTEAKIDKIISAEVFKNTFSLEEGIKKYVSFLESK